MALGTTVYASSTSMIGTGARTNLIGHSSKWLTAIDATGMTSTDNSGSKITSPDTMITGSTRKIIVAGGAGTLMLVRFARYILDDVGPATLTNPVIQVFGRSSDGSDTDTWMGLRNKANAEEITLTTAVLADVNDATGGSTYYFSAVDLDDHYIDIAGCHEILVGVKTAYSSNGGSADLTKAFCQVKFI